MQITRQDHNSSRSWRARFRAKWEDRDTRWIVEERKDGANVNAWHWSERSCLAWSRQRLGELLTGLPAELDPSLGHARVTGVKELTGEARPARAGACACARAWEGAAAGAARSQ